MKYIFINITFLSMAMIAVVALNTLHYYKHCFKSKDQLYSKPIHTPLPFGPIRIRIQNGLSVIDTNDAANTTKTA
ncbi:defensin isoform X3 [Arctopsyche grandis]|uniref:defensin isoform X3 n=1 Tax=Arctopsyche grandis TaxID=121162 RepID=UPI00406D85F6